jgi:hypothetical protein
MDDQAALDRKRRRAAFLREREEAVALRARVTPRRSRRAQSRHRYLMSTYTR